MSTFKTNGIILKIKKQEKKSNMIVLFSKDFWKINCFIKKWKKEKLIDLWNNISCEIKVSKSNINEIQNISIINSLNYWEIDYSTIYEYLFLISEINKYCPYWMQFNNIYEIINDINTYNSITKEKVLFLRIKLYILLWYLWELNWYDKLYLYIKNSHIKDILKLKWLNETDINNIEKLLKNKIQ